MFGWGFSGRPNKEKTEREINYLLAQGEGYVLFEEERGQPRERGLVRKYRKSDLTLFFGQILEMESGVGLVFLLKSHFKYFFLSKKFIFLYGLLLFFFPFFLVSFLKILTTKFSDEEDVAVVFCFWCIVLGAWFLNKGLSPYGCIYIERVQYQHRKIWLQMMRLVNVFVSDFVFFYCYCEFLGVFRDKLNCSILICIFKIFIFRDTILPSDQFFCFVSLTSSFLIFVWFVFSLLFFSFNGFVETLILDVYNILKCQALNSSWFFFFVFKALVEF